jgi:hypothetical protein
MTPPEHDPCGPPTPGKLAAFARLLEERWRLSPKQIARLQRLGVWASSTFRAPLSLNTLAVLHGTDKWNHHWYTQHYERHFRPWKRRRVNLLEIGVGGYDAPRAGGASLRMWKQYFRRGQINGIDIHDKSALQESRIRIFQGSQADVSFLRSVHEAAGPFEIIIDDGSHHNEHVLASFGALFPLLAPGGLYVIEDVQSSYWPTFGGCVDRCGHPQTSMGFLKSLVDGLNHEEFLIENYEPTYFDRQIVALHFYHNLVFVSKGRNSEGSFCVKDGRLLI